MMSEELNPVRCGCGGEAYIFRGENRNWIFCVECHTESKPYETVEKAIMAWNKAMGADKVDELMEHIWREKLDTREKIADLVERMLR